MKHGGMTLMTGGPLCVATSSSEKTGRVGEVEGWLYMLESLLTVKLEVSSDKVECLWTRIRGRSKKADILVGVCYRPPNQDNEGDELFYKQLADVSKSTALLLVGDFNLLDICWELNTAQKRQSRKFLECTEDNFLHQLVNEPTRGKTPLDLLFTNREGLVGDVVVGGRLGHSDHEIIEFSILRDARRTISKTSTVDFRRADFCLFRSLVQSIPRETMLKNKGPRRVGHASSRRFERTGTGYTNVPKGSPAGKTTGLAKQGDSEGNQK